MNRPVRVGELRPSQLLHTFGIGAVVDLPSISALVQGLDEWAADHTEQVHQPRPLAAVRDRLGQQVATLRLPPHTPDDGNPFSDEVLEGGSQPATVRWPHGYSAAFDPPRLLDEDGHVLAERGDLVELEGGFSSALLESMDRCLVDAEPVFDAHAVRRLAD